MRLLLTVCLVFFTYLSALCQTWGDSTVRQNDIFYTVNVSPKFPGGTAGYYRFLADNLKSSGLPAAPLTRRIVQVKVFLNKTGKIVYAEIEKASEKLYNDAALAVVKAMPSWTPALQNNRPVYVAMSLPIYFVD